MSDNLLEDFDVQRGLRIWPSRMKGGYDRHRGGECVLCDTDNIKGEEIELAVGHRGFSLFHWLVDSQWAAEMEQHAFPSNDNHGCTLQTWLWLDDFVTAATTFCSTCRLDLPEVEVAIPQWQAQGAAIVFLGARPSRIWVAEQRIDKMDDEAKQCGGWSYVSVLLERIKALEDAKSR